MQIIHTISDLRIALKSKANIGFVPTMGNLHAGHIHLVELARQHATLVVVSIFVNPLQFGVNEDLASYPRTLAEDCERLKAAGTDIVFAPNVLDMYPDFDGNHLNQTMTVTPPAIADVLCGASRPGHFTGVATIVMKLLNIVQPTLAVFGKKDYQQLLIIKEMVRQFNMPTEIIAGETMREPSGLAMSSRNGYLNEAQRSQAAQLNQALQHVASAIKMGNRDYHALENHATQQLNQANWQVDYFAVCSALTLQAAQISNKHLVILAAAKLSNKLSGQTRLIDNLEVQL